MKGTLAVLAIAISLAGCWKKELTQEEKALVARLNAELQQTKEEVAAANATSSRYSGGLIKALADTRAEILKTNQALLEQRIQAIESGAPIKVEVVTSAPNNALATSLASEIEATKQKVVAANAEASRYSGGLLQVVKLSVAATQEQTLALLEHNYLVAKYGLSPVNAGPASGTEATGTPPSNEPAATVTPPAKASIPPADGPLGLAEGLNLEEIEGMTGSPLVLVDKEQNLYSTSTPPKPNGAFETVAMVVSPTVGLCQIRALSSGIETNGFGHQVKSAFAEMQEALTSAYGRGETVDQLMYGSLWKDPDEWMMGLYKKDRVLGSSWTSKPGAPLKNNVESINMEARARTTSEGFYLVQYNFSNYSACEAEEKNNRTDSL